MGLADLLPGLNALLNATSGVLVFLGWRAIKAQQRERHKRLMLAACGSSTLFLVGYFTRIALTGTHRFPGDGPLKAFYLVLLGSHTLLAAATLPLVLRSLFLSLNSRFPEHRAIARWTFPVWMYVSVTGVLVYVMLYQVAPRVLPQAVALLP
jgi:putative membrane protein